MNAYTYHQGDTEPARVIGLASSTGGTWLHAGDTVAAHDHLPDGTVVIINAAITDQGDGATPATITIPAPSTILVGNVRTRIVRTGSHSETMPTEIVYVVVP
ncbi:MAG TPA: hypothetical protein VGM51_09515 [Armatimonadota bacterium]|jgi:hypothetical protein